MAANKTYSLEDRDRGMLAVILAAGNAAAASKQLAAQGHKIPAQMLNLWRRQNNDRYCELELTYAPQITQRIAADYEAFNIEAAAVRHEALMKARELIPRLDARDAAGFVRNIATAMGISSDKAAMHRGQPTAITETRSADQIMSALTTKLGIGRG